MKGFVIDYHLSLGLQRNLSGLRLKEKIYFLIDPLKLTLRIFKIFVYIIARLQDNLEEKFGAIGCNSRNAEVKCNNIKECVLDTLSVLVGKVEKKVRKPWKQEMISKMDERRKWKNVNTEEGRKNYRRLRNELKRATDNAKKEYLENICNGIMEFQRTGRYDLMYMKTKELG